MRLVALAIVALAACTEYAHVSPRNAPGNVDLAQPVAHENGDPARYEPPVSPGMRAVALLAAPYVLGGNGRYDTAGEAGLEFRVERSDGDYMRAENWGIGAGVAFAQWGDGHTRTIAPGAFYAEASYRVLPRSLTPFTWDFAAGPLVYVDDSSVGVQATLRVLIGMFRVRYVANTGWEVLGGAEIPIPFLFGWSR